MNQAVKWLLDTFVPSSKPAAPPSPKKRTVSGRTSQGNDDLRDEFFRRPDDPQEKRTILQDRMQSGGA